MLLCIQISLSCSLTAGDMTLGVLFVIAALRVVSSTEEQLAAHAAGVLCCADATPFTRGNC